jgi:hypothetical protein
MENHHIRPSLRYQPRALAVLRIVTALLFVHGGM